MAFFNHKQILDLDKIYKINLINSCSGFKSANLLGSVSKEGIPNVAVFSSVTHLGSNPPTLGFILRPTTVPRDTYKNIKENGSFTINHIYEDIIEDAHHTSAKYPEKISEFNVTNLEEEYKGDFKAPFVKNAPVQMSMKFIEEIYIPSNEVVLIVSQIEELYVKDELLQKDGLINLSKGNVVTINGLDTYAIPKFKKQLSYQRPKKIEKIV
jgi:flavin reductase (DIM6/NTAB) family NADH-FMN oxidoreductase RutF